MLAASVAALPAPAAATASPGSAYVQARAASMSGDHQRSARLLAELMRERPSDSSIARRAVGAAVSAGDMRLALDLARKLPANSATVESRLLLAADELRRGRHEYAARHLQGTSGDASVAFIAPLIEIWRLAERRDPKALELLAQLPRGNPVGAYAAEHRAFILLKLGRGAEAEPIALQAADSAGGREHRLRLAFADAYLALGDRERAMKMVEGLGTEVAAARARIAAGRSSGLAVDTAAKAYAEFLLGLAIDLNRLNDRALPIGIVQVARMAAPENSGATIILAALLDNSGRTDDALAALRTIPATDALAPQARDSEARILTDAKRFGEALPLAMRAASSREATVSDHARLGDVLSEMDRHNEAAEAYGRAIALAQREPVLAMWPLHLLRASAFEDAGRWPEARRELEIALNLAPDQPLILNFLGYGKLERGEDLDAAEAMIRKASALAPDDASITDSLGWALFKRGRLPEAIETLQRAAARDPGQAEIHEHLGDALFTAGRKFEARFAWEAALITAEDEVATRVRSKLEGGLTTATAAP